MTDHASSLNSEASSQSSKSGRSVPGWIKLTAIAAGSVLAGGLAAAWFYRKAISRLQTADQTGAGSNFGISSNGAEDES